MKKVLVIGAGYVGDEVLRVFRRNGWEAVGATLSGGEGLVSCDVSDAGSVERLPDADVVVHCAASGRGGADAYRRVYLEGCRNVVKRFRGKRLLFTSSSSVYAQVDGEQVTEESAAEPDRETGQILLEAETVMLGAGGVVARLAGIYGPGRSVLLRKFLSGEAVIEEDGRRFINQIHRDDAARAIFHLMTMEDFPGGEVFNVVDSVRMSQREVYEGLAVFFDRDLPPFGERDLNRKRGWTHKDVSNAKLRGTGWEPLYAKFLDAVEKGGEICASRG
ncbi:MAG: NAD-dependent epimerase/dehydratase family protein [Luteolibacter sp.]